MEDAEVFGVGPIRAGVVVDEEFIAGRIVRGSVLGRLRMTRALMLRGRRVSDLRRGPSMRLMTWPNATDEELAGEGNVCTDITVHAVFAEHIDAELFARLRESEEAIEADDIGEQARPLIVVGHAEEVKRQVHARLREETVDGGTIIVVDPVMLMMEGMVDDPASQPSLGKGPFDERFKLDVTVIERVRNRATQLNLVRLETAVFISETREMMMMMMEAGGDMTDL